jgi:hypothetical protein
MREITNLKNYIGQVFKKTEKICEDLRKKNNNLQSFNNSLFKNNCRFREKIKCLEGEKRFLKGELSLKRKGEISKCMNEWIKKGAKCKCGHSVLQHDFSHNSRCWIKECNCNEFTIKKTKEILKNDKKIKL